MSTLRVNTLQDVAGTGQPALPGAAKVWVNFNGTGTVAIRASFNVSSITDNGVGDYTVNFTTALQDVNYCVNATGSRSTSDTIAISLNPTDTTITSSSVRLLARAYNLSVDRENVCVSIFR